MVRDQVLKILHNFNQKHKDSGFKLVGIFGSFARGEEDIFSDIDISYTIDHEKFFKDDAFAKLIKINQYRAELEKSLKRKVDLVPIDGLNKHIKHNYIKEVIEI